MENSNAPAVRGEPGGHQASRRGRDLLDAQFFFLLMLSVVEERMLEAEGTQLEGEGSKDDKLLLSKVDLTP